jgi:hypothetical protein
MQMGASMCSVGEPKASGRCINGLGMWRKPIKKTYPPPSPPPAKPFGCGWCPPRRRWRQLRLVPPQSPHTTPLPTHPPWGRGWARPSRRLGTLGRPGISCLARYRRRSAAWARARRSTPGTAARVSRVPCLVNNPPPPPRTTTTTTTRPPIIKAWTYVNWPAWRHRRQSPPQAFRCISI